MNRKEISEIKRRMRPGKNNISRIYGCYVNCSKEIISDFEVSPSVMSGQEAELYFSLLRKSLTGTAGKSLVDLSFTTKAVMESEAQKLLAALRNSELKNPEIREEFFKCVVDNLEIKDTNYLVLLAYDVYDVPSYGKDGVRQELSDNVFRYVICSICPVKTAKTSLEYNTEESIFKNSGDMQMVSPAELGFMYPAFDDRSANIYGALYYMRSKTEAYKDFIRSVFSAEAPVPVARQKELFNSAVTCSAAESLSYEAVRSIHEQLSDCIEVHRESKDPDPLVLTGDEMGDILEKAGFHEEEIKDFMKYCAEDVPEKEDVIFRPSNIIDRKFVLNTPNVKISVAPEYRRLVDIREIEGKKFILIPADAGVELNGINVDI